MAKILVLLSILMASAVTQAAAQERDRKYVVGIRSAVIMGTMNLSGLDPAFDDLASDGLKGPHMSGFFLLYKVRPHLRIGIETLVSNSDQAATTTMNYQAAGPVVELTYGASWFITGGVHAGGLIVNAMARQGALPSEGTTSGTFYKDDGAFLAPYADVGRRFRRTEVSLYMKQVNIVGEISGFSSRFFGLRFAVGL